MNQDALVLLRLAWGSLILVLIALFLASWEVFRLRGILAKLGPAIATHLDGKADVVFRQAQEIVRLQGAVEGLCARVADQSALLSRRAERPSACDCTDVPFEAGGES